MRRSAGSLHVTKRENRTFKKRERVGEVRTFGMLSNNLSATTDS
jgi:hypothetical protein